MANAKFLCGKCKSLLMEENAGLCPNCDPRFSAYNEFLKSWEGKLTLEDLVMMDATPVELKKVYSDEDVIALAHRAGKKRRQKWPYRPDKTKKEEIRNKLINELKMRPNIDPPTFDALFGVGYFTYFKSWSSARELAGQKPRGSPKAFEQNDYGRKIIFEYALGLTEDGTRPTQKNIKKRLCLHYTTYGFKTMDAIKYPALEIVVYKMLTKDPDSALIILSERTGYSKRTLREKIDLVKLRELARQHCQQVWPISATEISIDYKQ